MFVFDDQGAPVGWPLTTTTRWASTNPKIMSAPLPNLPELPVEILEQVLLCLPGQDIVKMEAVRCVIVIPRDSTALTFGCTV